jgi:hypothetical protein
MQMKSSAPRPSENLHRDPPDFSLILGGPLYQLFRKAHLMDDHLMLLRRRIVVITLFAWLPLLVLSALEGNLLGGSTAVPFLMDVAVHARFLLAIPLLIAAELIVHQRMRHVVRQFLDRYLIPDSALSRFDAAIASAFRLRNSLLAEVLLIACVYSVGIVLRQYNTLQTATWYATPSAGGSILSPAGIWFAYVSVPFFQFLLLRWYYRLIIWMRFLWQVSRIELQLVPTHPDRIGGLGFLAATANAFTLLAAAHGVLLAGSIANQIFYLGTKLTDFKIEIATVVVFILCLALGPLLVFAPQLLQAKLRGNREYGTLAQRYVREFDAKWLRGGAPADEPLIGSSDIQSLADLGNSLQSVQSMSILIVTKGAVVQLALATLAPIVPLALTMMPLEELLKMLFGLVF